MQLRYRLPEIKFKIKIVDPDIVLIVLEVYYLAIWLCAGQIVRALSVTQIIYALLIVMRMKTVSN